MLSRLVLALCLFLSTTSIFAADQKKLAVFAAASLVDVLPKLGNAWQKRGGQDVVFSFDGSSRLAMQIKEGAPADVFISADEEWMDMLAKASLIDASSRQIMVRNKLVLVGSKKRKSPLHGGRDGFPFDKIPKIALAGEHVPAGKYAEAGLKSLRAWDPIKAKVVRGDNVRTVLSWVASNEIPYGVVYSTDALTASANVDVLYQFPAQSHPAIVYPMAVTRRSTQKGAKDFLTYLGSEEARKVFTDAGFDVEK